MTTGAGVVVENCAKTFADGTRALHPVTIEIAAGETVAILGPSGCGKTTALRIIAGLEQPDRGGRVLFDGADVTRLPIEQRNVGMVFQSYALFPNMSVIENVAYGLRVRGVPRREREKEAATVLAMMRIDDLAARRIDQLSGGQRQRVALARALAIKPRLLLLDEPLTALDATLREELRTEIDRLLRDVGITSVYVTHDQEEALAISDRVIVMNVGVIEQIGTPAEIYNRPRNRFVADFVGSANLLKGRVRGPAQGNRITFEADGGHVLQAVAPATLSGRETEVAVRTAYIGIDGGNPGDNQLPGTVRRRMFHGDFVQYVVDCSTGPTIVRRPPTNLIDEGASVVLSFPPESCVLLEA